MGKGNTVFISSSSSYPLEEKHLFPDGSSKSPEPLAGWPGLSHTLTPESIIMARGWGAGIVQTCFTHPALQWEMGKG